MYARKVHCNCFSIDNEANLNMSGCLERVILFLVWENLLTQLLRSLGRVKGYCCVLCTFVITFPYEEEQP